ncbi:MAG: cytochrome c3 family protein, partial [Paracoccaceae bacterium]
MRARLAWSHTRPDLPLVAGLATLVFTLLLSLAVPGPAVAQKFPLRLAGFNHGFTKFPLTGAHADVACESCHINGALTDTPRACESCHDDRAAGGKSRRHPPTGEKCAQCHTTISWTPFRFEHSDVSGDCASCHDGKSAVGRSASHIPSAKTCEDCHVTANWANVRLDHASVTGACVSCHQGRTATGKIAGHIASAETCADCHVTTGWSNV